MGLVYKFQTVPIGKTGRYIVQHIKKRRLTAVCHSHDFYEILYVVQGCCEQEVNGVPGRMESGEAILLRPGDTHFFSAQSSEMVLLSFSVEAREFALVCAMYGDNVKGEIDREKQPHIFWGAERVACTECRAEEAVFRFEESDCKLLLACFLKAYIDHRRMPQKLPRSLSKAVEEMKKAGNLQQGIVAFTTLSGYSHSQLARLIKKYFGVTVKQYINELRLQSVYRDIVFTDHPITELAEGVGFLSFSHFNKLFKERFGVTPAALRRQNSVRTV